jgi:2-C-methyl-D-erythritol 2,4-cyclodiphosphate synthase
LRESVARLLGVKPGEVGIKAKTPEGLNLDHVAQGALHGAAGEPAWSGRARTHGRDRRCGSEEELNAVVEGLVGVAATSPRSAAKVTPFDTDDLT